MSKVWVKSNISGKVKTADFTSRQFLGMTDESDLVEHMTMCDCQTVGETNVVECNCDDEWSDVEVTFEDELTSEGVR